MDKRYDVLREIVRDKMSYAAHDLDHTERVTNLCLYLAEGEPGIDLEVLIPAALLHDIARRIEDEDPTGEVDHALLGAEMAGEILQDLGYEKSLIEKIKYCIKAHRFRSGTAPETSEAKILFDADKLDVIGAIGIARSFMLAGRHGERMYNDIPLAEYRRENIGQNGRVKDVSKHTAYFEYELKLKHIPERLFTLKAKKIAEVRVKYMEEFFQRLKEEVAGQV
ncbi:MAG TPA: HD domain-containing protein [Peptococcaceae bacterium]|nr:HD domain-containing protein [Peptococcaceae bacterium]